MSNTLYIEKKLKPFKQQVIELEKENQQLEEQLQTEELNNETYFNELIQTERDIDEGQKQIEQIQKEIEKYSTTDISAANNQGLDQKLENKVKVQLSMFLLKESKKDLISMGQKVGELDDEEMDASKSYVIKIKESGKVSTIEVPNTNKLFSDLRVVMANYYMVNIKQIFFTDQMGNILQFNMQILDSMYPPIYELLRNYDPQIGVEIRRAEKKEEKIYLGQEEEEEEGLLKKTFKPEEKRIKKVEWAFYFNLLSQAKYIFESLLFLAMVIFYILVHLNSQEFVMSQQITNSFQQQFSLNKTKPHPEASMMDFVIQSIPSNDELGFTNRIFPTMALKKGILVQGLAEPKPFEDCLINNEDQKQMYIDSEQSCLDYQVDYQEQLEVEGVDDPNVNVYNSEYNGYVWEFDISSQEALLASNQSISDTEWLQYNRKFALLVINFYNAPTKRLIQVKLSSTIMTPDERMYNLETEINVYDLEGYTATEQLVNQGLFYIAVVLLIFSVFDFFGVYLANSGNNLLVIYNECNKYEDKFKKLKKRNQQINPADEEDYHKKRMVIEEYWIINFKVVYLVIKKPLIFDYIYMFSFLMILAQDSLYQAYYAAASSIDLISESYQNADTLQSPETIFRAYSAVIILLIMISVIRFLGNWSPYLKCYGIVMIRFTQQSSFIMFVLVYIIAFCSMAWIVTAQAVIKNYTSFIYVFLGLLRCTLRSTIHTEISQEPLRYTVIDDISFSFELRYIQYILFIIVTLVMVPIFISLMTQEVHNTKEEAKQRLAEMEKQMEAKLRPKKP